MSAASQSMHQLWRDLTEEYKLDPRVVRGWVPLLGWFDLRGSEVWRVEPWTRKRLSTARPATGDELDQIDWAMAHGAFQIELRPIEGLCGGHGGQGRTIAQAEYQPRVLYRATGRSVPL